MDFGSNFSAFWNLWISGQLHLGHNDDDGDDDDDDGEHMGASHSWLLSSPQGLTHSIISSTALFAKKPMNSAIIVMIMVNTTGHVVLYTNQYLPSHFLFRKVIGIL